MTDPYALLWLLPLALVALLAAGLTCLAAIVLFGGARRHGAGLLGAGVYAILLGQAYVLAVRAWGPSDNAYLALPTGGAWLIFVGAITSLAGTAIWLGVPALPAFGVAFAPIWVTIGVSRFAPLDGFVRLQAFGLISLLLTAGLLAARARGPTWRAARRALLTAAGGVVASGALLAGRGPGAWRWAPFGFEVIALSVAVGAFVFAIQPRTAPPQEPTDRSPGPTDRSPGPGWDRDGAPPPAA